MERSPETVCESDKKTEKKSFDDVIIVAGDFGRYERMIFLLLCLPSLSCGFHTMAGVFLAAEPDFRCLLPHESPENATYELSQNLTNILYPWKNETEDWPQCERYDVNLTDQYYNLNGNLPFETPTTKCNYFVYDKTTYELTVTTEFDLVCSTSWLRATADSVFMIGMLPGAIITGGLSDRLGRKPILCAILFIQAVTGFLIALSPEIISFMALRLLLAATANGAYLVSFVSTVEMVVPEKKLTVGTVVSLFFTTGYILTSAFAYFITNWRLLQIAITIPNLLFLVYWWLIPESARWLVSAGRLEEARICMQKASSVNGIELSEDKLNTMLDDCSTSKLDSEKSSFIDLLRYPNLRRRSLLLFFNWFINNCTYFGLSWNTSSLGGNEYMNFALGGIVEIPANLFVLYTLNKWGRKKILCTSMIVCGMSMFLTILVPDHLQWLNVLFTMLGKFAATSAFATVFVFTAEQYPTVIRNVGIGACSTWATIGGILAPYINYSSTLWVPLPAVLFGFGSLIGGLSTLLLPETLGEKLPETLEDGEHFGQSREKSEKSLSH